MLQLVCGPVPRTCNKASPALCTTGLQVTQKPATLSCCTAASSAAHTIYVYSFAPLLQDFVQLLLTPQADPQLLLAPRVNTQGAGTTAARPWHCSLFHCTHAIFWAAEWHTPTLQCQRQCCRPVLRCLSLRADLLMHPHTCHHLGVCGATTQSCVGMRNHEPKPAGPLTSMQAQMSADKSICHSATPLCRA